MNFNKKYISQVELLLEIIPFVASEKCFALKGGSAINLFYQNLPRLSVDLDLVYVPTENREDAFESINASLNRIQNNLREAGYEANIQGKSDEKKIICSNHRATVKIEPNYTIRGTLIEPKLIKVSEKVQQLFGYAKMNVLVFEELYAGKICAALDRQHPRDLFDIKNLYKNYGGISEQIVSCFLVYLIGHNRPIHELLDCKIKDNFSVFEKEFRGMTDESVSYEELMKTLSCMKSDLHKKLADYKGFLLDFIRLNADFSALPFKNVQNMSAIKWKIQNLERLRQSDPHKFNFQYEKLSEYFSA